MCQSLQKSSTDIGFSTRNFCVLILYVQASVFKSLLIWKASSSIIKESQLKLIPFLEHSHSQVNCV